jgi:uncharacterized protein YkwD
MKKLLWLIIPVFVVISGFQDAPKKAVVVTATSDEWELYRLINKYRKENNLSEIPFSASLTHVAQKHCEDLSYKIGHLTHAWSDCNYNPADMSTFSCMWDQPRKLTTYPGNGYECAHGASNGYKATPKSSLDGWKGSKPHNAVFLNQGIWKDMKWGAIGIGMKDGYACVWFGEETDPAGEPKKP